MAADYTIAAVRQSQDIQANGTLGDIMEVTFELVDSGSIGTVRVPLAGDWVSAAQSAIEAQVAQMKAVLAL